MHEYVFRIKKGDVEIELKTDNISFFEQQVNNWNDKLLNIKYEDSTKIGFEKQEEILPSEINVENNEIQENQEKELEQEEIVVENNEEQETQVKEIGQEEIERESQRILDEYKAELEQENQERETFNQEIKDILDETNDSEENTNNENVTSLFEENTNETEFDNILQESMSQCISNIQENRDENFINHIKEKNITEKIDFLITTAYYLEKNQNYETFTLNQINKKLTENSFESIEYSVMQDAVENGFAEIVPIERATETQYRLTEEYKSFVAERAAQNV